MSKYFLLDEASGVIVGKPMTYQHEIRNLGEGIVKPGAPLLICNVVARISVEMKRETDVDSYPADVLLAFDDEPTDPKSDGIEVNILASASSGSEPAPSDDDGQL